MTNSQIIDGLFPNTHETPKTNPADLIMENIKSQLAKHNQHFKKSNEDPEVSYLVVSFKTPHIKASDQNNQTESAAAEKIISIKKTKKYSEVIVSISVIYQSQLIEEGSDSQVSRITITQSKKDGDEWCSIAHEPANGTLMTLAITDGNQESVDLHIEQFSKFISELNTVENVNYLNHEDTNLNNGIDFL